MGKAVSKNIRARSEVLLKNFPGKFGDDFEKNKKALDELDLPLSKPDRNILAGFICRELGGKNT